MWFELEDAGTNHVNLSVKNQFQSPVHLLRWNTCLQSLNADSLEIFDEDGNLVEYIGPRYKFVFNPQESIAQIGALHVMNFRINVPRLYNVKSGRSYKILAKLPAISTSSESLDGIQTLTQFHEVDDGVEFIKKPLEKTFSDIQRPWNTELNYPERQEDAMDADPGKCPIVLCNPYGPGRNIGKAWCRIKGIIAGHYVSLPICSASLSPARVRRIAELSTAMSDEAGRHLKNPIRVADDKYFKKWFGYYTSERAEKVKRTISRSKPIDTCKTSFFTLGYFLPGDDRSAVASARWIPGSKTVNISLYPKFWTLPFSGRDSQIGTFVHEYSHGFDGTIDKAYGESECLALARTSPEVAIRNADNIEYFAEDQFGNVKKPQIGVQVE